jgi:hypothetical protein
MNYKRVNVASIPQKVNSQENRWWFFEAIAVLDGDRDGDLDIFVGMTGAIWNPLSATDPKPYFIENVSANKFVLNGISISKNLVAGWINNIVVGDFNSDGFDDAFLVDHGREDKPHESRDYGPLNLVLSAPTDLTLRTTLFETSSTWNKPNFDFWHGAINTRDFNLDGHLDIVATALGRAGVQLWFGDGLGNFKFAPLGTLPDYINRTAPYSNGELLGFGISGFIDAGGDGIADVFCLPYNLSDKNSAGFISINPLSNNGVTRVINLGDLAVDSGINNNWNRGYSEAVVADFDGNGLEDIIAIAEASNGKADGEMFFMFLSQTSANVFKDLTLESFGTYSSKYKGVQPRGDGYADLFINSPSTELYVSDFNGDGFLDLNLGFGFLGQWSELKNTVFLNDGKAHFSRNFDLPLDFHSPKYGSLRTDGVSDLNSDGIGDFFVVEQEYVNGEVVDNIVLLISDPLITNGIRHFLLSESSSKVVGSISNDVFISIGGGNHSVIAGGGIDTVKYTEKSSFFSVSKSTAAELIVTKPKQFSSVDRLSSVERIEFSDKSNAYDLDGNAGTTAKILGAVFGKDSLSNKQYVGIGLSLLDAGMSTNTLSSLAVDAANLKTNDQIVSTLWKNVFGTTATSADKAPYVKLLEDGMSSGTLAWLAADTNFNKVSINLVGLAQAGIEYIPVS